MWSGFTKTLRAVALKHTEDEIVIKTVYFGKFYLSKLSGSGEEGKRQIVYQPPAQLAASVKQVANDSGTLPYGHSFNFSSEDSLLFSKELKLNMLSIAKASNQSLATVETVLPGLIETLVAILPTVDSKNGRVKINFKLGQLLIQSNCL